MFGTKGFGKRTGKTLFGIGRNVEKSTINDGVSAAITYCTIELQKPEKKTMGKYIRVTFVRKNRFERSKGIFFVYNRPDRENEKLLK